MITDKQRKKLDELLLAGNQHGFYLWKSWRNLREKVIEMDNHECQICKAKGKYSAAVIVHHIKHLDDRPDLALSIYDDETGERQLISLCKQCHEDQHPDALREIKIAQTLTEERWD